MTTVDPKEVRGKKLFLVTVVKRSQIMVVARSEKHAETITCKMLKEDEDLCFFREKPNPSFIYEIWEKGEIFRRGWTPRALLRQLPFGSGGMESWDAEDFLKAKAKEENATTKKPAKKAKGRRR